MALSLNKTVALPAQLLHKPKPQQHVAFRTGRYLQARKVVRVAVTSQLVQDQAQPSSSDVSNLEASFSSSDAKIKPIKILVAGAGIGGLVFALGAKNRGIQVEVFERDLTAIRGEGQYRGPIQIQSNALAALEAVDQGVADELMAEGCVTGDRVNGLCDGLTGEWYVKFDTFTPAAESGLPVTRVISRIKLQEILAKAVGEDIIHNGATVVDFKDEGDKVSVTLSDGRVVYGDVLIGADGIRSKVRDILLGPTMPTYSDYTCYTGICDFTPPDIDTVGYRVFLGNKQYFVSSDVGHGKMQWYAFYNEAAGGTDPPNCRKTRLMELFGHWCESVTDLIKATPEEDVLRRDIYDRIPIMTWSRGRVTLLGDAAHAMQPNLGQGGCMAIEDGYQLALDFDQALTEQNKTGTPVNLEALLHKYEQQRRLRVGAVHGMARMAAIMATTYKAYFGEGMGPLEFLTQFRIPHWGRVAGQAIMKLTMPLTLQWVLGGNQFALEGRAPSCRLADKANSNLKTWLEDDDALERATEAKWYLLPAGDTMPASGLVTDTSRSLFPISCAVTAKASTMIGSTPSASSSAQPATLPLPGVEAEHCLIESYPDHSFYATDVSQSQGTWVIRVDGSRSQLPKGTPVRIHPGDLLQFGPNEEATFRVKLRKEEPALAQAA